MENDARRPSLDPSRFERAVQDLAIAVRQIGKKFRSRHEAEGFRRDCVGLDDAQIAGAHDRHALRRGVQQGAIAGLDVAELPVVAFAFLLDARQPRLEVRKRLDALADRDEAGAAAELDGRILELQFAAAGQPLADDEAGGLAFAGRELDRLRHAVRRVWRNGFGPLQSAPLVEQLARKRLGGNGASKSRLPRPRRA